MGKRTKWHLIPEVIVHDDPDAFRNLIKSEDVGAIAHLKFVGLPKYSFVSPTHVSGPDFTNWNLTKIDHVFFGLPGHKKNPYSLS